MVTSITTTVAAAVAVTVDAVVVTVDNDVEVGRAVYKGDGRWRFVLRLPAVRRSVPSSSSSFVAADVATSTSSYS